MYVRGRVEWEWMRLLGTYAATDQICTVNEKIKFMSVNVDSRKTDDFQTKEYHNLTFFTMLLYTILVERMQL